MTEVESTPRTRGIWIAGGAVVVGLLALGAAACWGPWSRPADPPAAPPENVSSAEQAARFPLPPTTESPFLNTRAEATYVGSEACLGCHEEEHESFRHTGMGRSMSTVDLAREPPDGQFDHPLSQRRYQVHRRDGRMWHRELLLTDDTEEMVLSEFPVKYVTGSGRHSLTYVVETGGFLVESPITWYTSRQAWGMSPGYDRANHSGFQREIGEGCLVCHVGRAEAIDSSLHRLRILEESIGCERCHGPGSLHVASRTESVASTADDEAVDYTIVNPAHLSRDLAEAVCQQCHLRTSATVLARGRKAADFRPGLPLQDFRQDYTLTVPNKAMTVVGHVEQMHISRCYQASDQFTCSTCHSPHGEPPPEQKVAFYKAVCLKCHQESHCQVDKDRLAAESAANDCVQCHMPTSPTDIPHLAFTHHRVGIHEPSSAKEAEPPANDEAGVLQPFLKLSGISDIDRQRSLGMAYYDLAMHAENSEQARHYRQQALDLLSKVYNDGLRDGPVCASIASLRFDLQLGNVVPYATEALADQRLGGMDRSNSLFMIADACFREGRFLEALAVIEPLNDVRRHSMHWLLKAQCEEELGRNREMIESLEKALEINPRIPDAHRFLATYFAEQGNAVRARWHARLAKPQ